MKGQLYGIREVPLKDSLSLAESCERKFVSSAVD